jgi:hypothetical protein
MSKSPQRGSVYEPPGSRIVKSETIPARTLPSACRFCDWLAGQKQDAST